VCTPATFKVYRLNDYEWWMATSLEEAIAAAMKETGLPRDEASDDPYELSNEDLQRLIFRDDDGNRRTFAEELIRRAESDPRPHCFAAEE
jgi:hypothetical protein